MKYLKIGRLYWIVQVAPMQSHNSLGPYIYKNLSFTNRDSFIFCFHSGKCLGETFSIFYISYDASWGLSVDAIYQVSIFPSVITMLSVFYYERVLDFIKCAFCSYQDDHEVFGLFLIKLVIVFHMLNQLCTLCINSTWSWWIILFIYAQWGFLVFCLVFLQLYLSSILIRCFVFWWCVWF